LAFGQRDEGVYERHRFVCVFVCARVDDCWCVTVTVCLRGTVCDCVCDCVYD
jgi:hypothetical protein